MSPDHDVDYSDIVALCDENLDDRPRHDQAFLDALKADLDAIELPPDDDPAPVNVPAPASVTPEPALSGTPSAETLDDDDLAAIDELDLAPRRSLIEAWLTRHRAGSTYSTRLDDAFKAARDRIREVRRVARRERDRDEKRAIRRSEPVMIARRTSALENYIATTVSKFTAKLRGRALEIATFRAAMDRATAKFGAVAGYGRIAAEYNAMIPIGAPAITKPGAQNRVAIVQKLEAVGGPWRRLR